MRLFIYLLGTAWILFLLSLISKPLYETFKQHWCVSTVDDGGDGGFELMEPEPEDDQHQEAQQVRNMTWPPSI